MIFQFVDPLLFGAILLVPKIKFGNTKLNNNKNDIPFLFIISSLPNLLIDNTTNS